MIVIGLTGGIATGKSTVSHYLKTLNYSICDTDILARDIVQKGSNGLNKLVDYFGNDLLLNDGTLNRNKLANIIFNNVKQREVVNNILHPLVFEKVDQWLKQQSERVVFIDMPLLFEVNYDKYVDMTMVVYATLPQQVDRLMKRNNYSYEQAIQRINAQLPIEEKIKNANIVIDNSKNKDYTKKQIRQFLKSL